MLRPLLLGSAAIALLLIVAVGVAAIVGSRGGRTAVSGAGAPGASSAASVPAVRWAQLHWPISCPSGFAVSVQYTTAQVDRRGDGVGLAAVRCAAGAGAPPSEVYAVDVRRAVPRIASVLVPEQAGLLWRSGRLTGSEASLTLYGYSAPDVPRCCPDRTVTKTFRHENGRWVATATRTAERPIAAFAV